MTKLNTSSNQKALNNFISRSQLVCILAGVKGEEKAWFQAKVIDLLNQFSTMPKVYEQDGLGKKAIAHLHYFSASGDWYITERDTSADQHQAFGLVQLAGYDAEMGYISIAELIRTNRVELDLHWTPKTLAECEK